MPRQIAMYLCKALTHASLPEIGRSFGGKHHSTVIHSIKKVDELRKRDGDFNSLITNFLESFQVNPHAFNRLARTAAVDDSGVPKSAQDPRCCTRRETTDLSTP